MGKNSGHEKAPVLAGAEALDNVNRSRKNVMSDNSTAESSVIPFRSAKLLLVERDGQPFIPMKPVVEGMGLDWKSQHAKLQGGRFNSVMVMITTTGADGKQYEMACLPLRKLAGWLMSIHASKVRPELRDGVIDYQNECDDALWSYWNQGRAVNHRETNQSMTVLGQTIGTDGFHMLGAIVKGKVASLPVPVQRRATAKIWSQVHAAFGVRSAADIPAEHLDGARNFIASYAVLEGEFLGKEKSHGLSMSLQDWVDACPGIRHAQAGQPVGRVVLTGALCADMDTVKPLQRLINQLAKQGVDVTAYEVHYHFLLEYLRENRRYLRDAQRLMEKASENEFAFRTRVAA